MTERTRQERANARRYTIHMAAAAVAYLVVMLVPPFIVERDTPLGVIVALAPIVPVVWMVLAVVQFTRNLDEYYRPRMMTATAVGFVAAMLSVLVLGMLESALGPIPHAIWGVFVVSMSVWGIAMLVLTARDRS